MIKDLKKMSIEQILKNHSLPRRFYVYYASQVAKQFVNIYIKAEVIDNRSLKAIEIAERFGNGEDFTQEYLENIHKDAYFAYFAYSAAASAASAASAAYASAAATPSAASAAAASAATYASAAAYFASAAATPSAAASAAYASAAASAAYASAAALEYCKDLLLEIIETRLTKFERLLILGVDS